MYLPERLLTRHAGSFLHLQSYLSRGQFPAQARFGWHSVIGLGRFERLVPQPRGSGRGRSPDRWDHGAGEECSSIVGMAVLTLVTMSQGGCSR